MSAMLEAMARRIGTITGIVHVGANVGQEMPIYSSLTNGPVVLIEPIEEVFKSLKANCQPYANMIAVKALCAEQDGRHVQFNVSSNAGESSSMLDFGRHGDIYPQVTFVNKVSMVTQRLDTLIAALALPIKPNFLVMDTQATELLVLQGATGLLPDIDAVYTEVSSTPLYEGGCTLDEIAAFLRRHDLPILWTEMIAGEGWGDAFFLRMQRPPRATRGLTDLPTYGGNLARGKRALTSSQMFPGSDDRLGATNGRITGRYGFHTGHDLNPWWLLDLEKEHTLEEIRVFNRTDVAPERAYTLEVLVGDESGAWTLVHRQNGRPFGGKQGNPLRVFLKTVKARYIRLQLGCQSYLHLDEVEVY